MNVIFGHEYTPGTPTKEGEALDGSLFSDLVTKKNNIIDDSEGGSKRNVNKVEPCGLNDVLMPFGGTTSTTGSSSGAVGDFTITISSEEGGAEVDEEEFTDALLAVSDLLSTPTSLEYEDEALDTVINVQEACSADFEKYCVTTTTSMGGGTKIADFVIPTPTTSDVPLDILNFFESIDATFAPGSTLSAFSRRLMESEHNQLKLEERSRGLKLLRELRDLMLVPAQHLGSGLGLANPNLPSTLAGAGAADDASSHQRRRLTVNNRKQPSRAVRSTSSSRREDASIEEDGGETAEHRHRKAEMKKLQELRAQYGGNPNRSKLSTRISRVPRAGEGRKLSSSSSPPSKPPPGSFKPKPNPHEGFHEDIRWRAHVDTDNSDSDSDDDDDDDDDDDTNKAHSMGKPWLKDTSYAGSLGFGEDGDACMYEVFPQLSTECKSAVSDMYDFRDDYFIAAQEAMAPHGYRHHHGHGFGLLLACIIFFVFAYKRRKKSQQIRKILNVIDANPHLKSQVEELAGCEIPEHNSGWKSTGACFRGMCKNAVMVATLFVLSLFVMFTSLLISIAIVSIFASPPDGCSQFADDGDDPCAKGAPTILFSLFTLFAVVCGEVYLLYGLLRACRCVGGSNDGGGSPDSPRDASHWRRFLPSVMGQSSPGGSNEGGDHSYAALSGTEHEMTNYAAPGSSSSPHAESPTVVRGPLKTASVAAAGQAQDLPQGVVTGRMVRAVPVSSMNML
jgi:hypothetical protein